MEIFGGNIWWEKFRECILNGLIPFTKFDQFFIPANFHLHNTIKLLKYHALTNALLAFFLHL